MRWYRPNIPQWLPKFFPEEIIWRIPSTDTVYFSFDDGPHPHITDFVLDTLKTYQAKASFFCIGKNVDKYPEVYQRILDEGHTTGNHTQHHFNGWKTQDRKYAKDILEASQKINNKIFRPPYGKIKRSQAHLLIKKGWKIYMWNVLSADFDNTISPQKCLMNVLNHIQPGAIIVFHDSEKAYNNLKFALPPALEYCREKGWKMEPVPVNDKNNQS